MSPYDPMALTGVSTAIAAAFVARYLDWIVGSLRVWGSHPGARVGDNPTDRVRSITWRIVLRLAIRLKKFRRELIEYREDLKAEGEWNGFKEYTSIALSILRIPVADIAFGLLRNGWNITFRVLRVPLLSISFRKRSPRDKE